MMMEEIGLDEAVRLLAEKGKPLSGRRGAAQRGAAMKGKAVRRAPA
jgi:hypothetical protein